MIRQDCRLYKCWLNHWNLQKFQMSKVQKNNRKQIRKPVGDKFTPKRLAINFDPPTIIMEYMVIDSGKLYHHKMRIDSLLKRGNNNRIDILNYIKNKHYLYFINGKIKDSQLLKFIDKILTRTGKGRTLLNQINQNLPFSKESKEDEGEFDYMDEDQDYDEEYEDYEDSAGQGDLNHYLRKENSAPTQKKVDTVKQVVAEEKDDGGFEWDLEMEEDADFV